MRIKDVSEVRGADVFSIPVCHGALQAARGGGDRNSELDGEVVGNVEIEATEVGRGDGLRRTHKVKCMAFIVGGEVNMLGDVEAV